jgi:hypothetical protein
MPQCQAEPKTTVGTKKEAFTPENHREMPPFLMPFLRPQVTIIPARVDKLWKTVDKHPLLGIGVGQIFTDFLGDPKMWGQLSDAPKYGHIWG